MTSQTLLDSKFYNAVECIRSKCGNNSNNGNNGNKEEKSLTNILQYSFSMERTDFPSTFYISGVYSNVQVNLTNDYIIPFSARNNHVFLKINSITPISPGPCTIEITGTQVDEETKTPNPNFMETIIINTVSNSYQSIAKFYDITKISINHTGSNISTIDYDIDILGYVDFLNSNVKIIGYRSEILGDLNSSDADITLSLIRVKQNGSVTTLLDLENIKIDGNYTPSNKGAIIDNIRTGLYNRSYIVNSGAELWQQNSYFVLKMSDFDKYFINKENYINGDNNEGLLIKIEGNQLGAPNGPRFINIQVYYEFI